MSFWGENKVSFTKSDTGSRQNLVSTASNMFEKIVDKSIPGKNSIYSGPKIIIIKVKMLKQL